MKRLIPFFCFWLLSVSLLLAQRPMSIVDFLNIPNLSSPRLSPDGSKLAYLKYESDWDANKRIGQLWVRDLNTDTERQYTYSANGVSSPLWSPNSKEIAFLSKREKDEHSEVYLLPITGGEAKRLFSHPTTPSSLTWSEEQDAIYFTAQEEKSKEQQDRDKLKDDVYAYDEDFQHRHLWRYDVEGEKTERLTEGEYSVLNYHMTEKAMLLQRGASPLFDKRPQTEIWFADVDANNARQLTENGISESNIRLSPSGSRMSFLSFSNKAFDFYYNDNLFLSGTNGVEKPDCPTDQKAFEVVSSQWGANDNQIFLLVNQGATTQLLELDVKKNRYNPLTSGNHNIGQWSYDPKLHTHVFIRNTMEQPGEIYLLKDGEMKQITNHMASLPETYAMPRQELISWKGADGQKVEGMIYYPADYQEGRRYPLVVQTHGGPASSDKFGLSLSFTRYNPVLTGKGYVVLQPNYRGSTGYGDDFLRDMVGGYFRQSHLDVMAGVDHLIEQGIADPDRMVKMGWSAGGHMTNKLITFTDRFKAASSGAGAINWVSMYGQSDVRTYRTPWFGGTPWEENAPIDTYWKNSPLSEIHKVKTPTLIIVGGNDPRVPPPQSIELLRALKGLGVPSHLYVAPREPHGWRELRHRLYKINVELEWFAKYALEQDYEWEEAPE